MEDGPDSLLSPFFAEVNVGGDDNGTIQDTIASPFVSIGGIFAFATKWFAKKANHSIEM